jgi:hypothetical protein
MSAIGLGRIVTYFGSPAKRLGGRKSGEKSMSENRCYTTLARRKLTKDENSREKVQNVREQIARLISDANINADNKYGVFSRHSESGDSNE